MDNEVNTQALTFALSIAKAASLDHLGVATISEGSLLICRILGSEFALATLLE